CEDRSGSLWIGTEGGGLTRMRQGLFRTWRASDGLPNDRVRAIVEDGAGVLWVGTDGGLARGGTWEGVIPDRALRALLARGDGTLWVGGRAGSLVPLRNGRPGTPLRLPGGGPVSALHEDEDGTLWVGRNDVLVRVGRGVTTALTARDGLPGRAVSAILRDRD